MDFILKKKKFMLQVNLQLEGLGSVSLVNAILFVKVRLLNGGSFTVESAREEVRNHCVSWNEKFQFCCKMTASSTSGILDSCLCRISVRKEVKGGKSSQKLGYADIDLAEYAGAGDKNRRYLLQGYGLKHRQDNSILKVSVDMTLLKGDPLFKTRGDLSPELLRNESFEYNSIHDGDSSSIVSGSSGFESLPKYTLQVASCCDLSKISPESLAGRSRNPSESSQVSKTPEYNSLKTRKNVSGFMHKRNLSTPTLYCPSPVDSLKRREKYLKRHSKKGSFDDTRVDANELISEIIGSLNHHLEEPFVEGPGMRLTLGKDGTPEITTGSYL